MTDNDFVRVGWTPTERLRGDQLVITEGSNEVTWDFDGLRFVAQPPQWRLEGAAGDAEFDLTYRTKGTPLWNWGPFSEADKQDRAGYDVFVGVDGTIAPRRTSLS